MKKLSLFISIFAVLLLAACGNNNSDSTKETDEKLPEMVQVEILLPEKIEPDEEVKIEALVTQGKEKVEDASEVTFEVWKQGQEKDHEMIEGKNDGSGIYSFTKTFEEEGLYFVVAHTTARDMHVMPRVEMTVGNPDPATKEGDESGHDHGSEHSDHEGSHDGEAHSDHESQDHEHAATLMMTLNNQEAVKVNREATLSTELKKDNAALKGATVRFEVWHADSEKHEFIDAAEVSEGVYEAKTTFKQKGKHNVQIHVEKDELHEHQLEELEVE
ncbi:hypothetical protein JOC95_002767 [Bacillus tianshenii]|uniref:YtkA-like domain-containing protein n=1 Tax=Sutcliffiella tianshenii TaxID=1463404 RepID=A0ABS2P2P8_9BACI|nr:FixH family protein [Bacillus tianshenii]MBM7620912.1 hypothetical protein [Bacillus tianshenii]